jgi:hypothetical protein
MEREEVALLHDELKLATMGRHEQFRKKREADQALEELMAEQTAMRERLATLTKTVILERESLELLGDETDPTDFGRHPEHFLPSDEDDDDDGDGDDNDNGDETGTETETDTESLRGEVRAVVERHAPPPDAVDDDREEEAVRSARVAVATAHAQDGRPGGPSVGYSQTLGRDDQAAARWSAGASARSAAEVDDVLAAFSKLRKVTHATAAALDDTFDGSPKALRQMPERASLLRERADNADERVLRLEEDLDMVCSKLEEERSYAEELLSTAESQLNLRDEFVAALATSLPEAEAAGDEELVSLLRSAISGHSTQAATQASTSPARTSAGPWQPAAQAVGERFLQLHPVLDPRNVDAAVEQLDELFRENQAGATGWATVCKALGLPLDAPVAGVVRLVESYRLDEKVRRARNRR